MKRLHIHPIGLALLAVLSWSATAHAADWGFTLNGPNTSTKDNGEAIQITGAGTFDTTAETVNANGSWTHLDSAGAVLARGTWSATAFVDFSQGLLGPGPGGGTSPGFQTGILDMLADGFPDGDGLAMRVVCNIPEGPNTPPGGFQTGVDQGTMVGDFDDTDVSTSFTLFNVHGN